MVHQDKQYGDVLDRWVNSFNNSMLQMKFNSDS